MNSAIGGLLLVSTFIASGCASALARYDAFERGDARIGRALETARKTCRAEQPNSAATYERCVLAELRQADLTAAR